jgi:hypothetical protein
MLTLSANGCVKRPIFCRRNETTVRRIAARAEPEASSFVHGVVVFWDARRQSGKHTLDPRFTAFDPLAVISHNASIARLYLGLLFSSAAEQVVLAAA